MNQQSEPPQHPPSSSGSNPDPRSIPLDADATDPMIAASPVPTTVPEDEPEPLHAEPGRMAGINGGDPGRSDFFGDLVQSRYREVTVAAILFALVVGVIMNAAITYSGLKIGFTLSGSPIAAVLGFGVLRGILKRGSILETNIAQTAASGINISNAGIIFTVPVLFLLGYQLTIGDADFWILTLAAVAGALLGVAFIIPLRKQMIDIERLRFPSAVGVATILKSPGAGPSKALVLGLGVLVGAAIYLPAGLPMFTSPAELDELESLHDQQRIGRDDVRRTRMIAGWIDSGAAPEAVVERGRVLSAIVDARASETPDADSIEAMERGLAALEDVPLVTDALARAAFEADRGDRTWASLKDVTVGWAADPMFGYADLGITMPREYALDTVERDADGDGAPDEEALVETARMDLDGDGVPDRRLVRDADRDQDGRPDLIVTDDTVDVGRMLGLPGQVQLAFAIAPFAIGAGYLTGRPGLFVTAGGILAFLVINPIAYAMGWLPAHMVGDNAYQAPGFAFQAFNRPLGIGLLLGGALMGILASLPAMKEAVKSIGLAGKLRGGSDELGFRTLALAVVLGVAALYLAADTLGNSRINAACPVTDVAVAQIDSNTLETVEYQGFTIGVAGEAARTTWEGWTDERRDEFLASINARPGILRALGPHLRAGIIALVGALWIWFAGIIIAQCTGMTDWSPISGLALLTVVLVMLLAGTGATLGAVLVGAALCVAISLAADMMGDLKTGYLVGALPRKQQTVQLAVVGLGPIICMLTLIVIVMTNLKSTGIAIGPGTATPAPQAQALEAVITGVQGGEMPYALYGLGAVIGALLGLGAFSGLGVLIGLSMYLPFAYLATYGIGCVVNILVARLYSRRAAEDWGVPFCAGLIVGESVLALGMNAVFLITGT